MLYRKCIELSFFFHGKKQQIPFARYTSSLIIFLWYIQHVFFSLWYFIFNFLHRWWCSWATAFSLHLLPLFFPFHFCFFFLPFLKRHVLILLDVHFFVKIIVILFEREEIKRTTLNWWAVEFAILSLFFFLLSSLLKNNKHGWWTGKTDKRLHWNVQFPRSAFIIYLTFRIE